MEIASSALLVHFSTIPLGPGVAVRLVGRPFAALAKSGIAANRANTSARARMADRVFRDVVFMINLPFIYSLFISRKLYAVCQILDTLKSSAAHASLRRHIILKFQARAGFFVDAVSTSERHT